MLAIRIATRCPAKAQAQGGHCKTASGRMRKTLAAVLSSSTVLMLAIRIATRCPAKAQAQSGHCKTASGRMNLSQVLLAVLMVVALGVGALMGVVMVMALVVPHSNRHYRHT
jgi:hypothetical protein